MVRAGAVSHPNEWAWCGYHEIVGKRQRYRLLNIKRLVEFLDLTDRKSLAEIHQQHILSSIGDKRLIREDKWTERIAVGSETFLREIISKNQEKEEASCRRDRRRCLVRQRKPH